MQRRIYFYRIKTSEENNFAPCWENSILTLACCKRDMRRMIGRQYKNRTATKENPVWIVGINGKDTKSRQGENRIRYIAKISNVVTFYDYFTSYRNRKDCIYDIVDKPVSFMGKPVYWKWRKNENDKHKDENLQARDWDIKGKADEKYVLLSDSFRFLNQEEADKLSETFPTFTCKGVGHRFFSDCTEGCDILLMAFHELIKLGPNCPKGQDDKNSKRCDQAV